MIPKNINYYWFGVSRLPELAKKCIESWRYYFPGYNILEERLFGIQKTILLSLADKDNIVI